MYAQHWSAWETASLESHIPLLVQNFFFAFSRPMFGYSSLRYANIAYLDPKSPPQGGSAIELHPLPWALFPALSPPLSIIIASCLWWVSSYSSYKSYQGISQLRTAVFRFTKVAPSFWDHHIFTGQKKFLSQLVHDLGSCLPRSWCHAGPWLCIASHLLGVLAPRTWLSRLGIMGWEYCWDLHR